MENDQDDAGGYECNERGLSLCHDAPDGAHSVPERSD